MSLQENEQSVNEFTMWEQFLYKITRYYVHIGRFLSYYRFTTTFFWIQIPCKCIFSYALLFVQLEDQSMSFIQFLERMNELGGDEIKERDCDEWFWKCDDENI